MRIIVMLIGLLTLMSNQVQAFSLYEWVREWHLELGQTDGSVRISQPANPIQARICRSYSNCTISTLHTSPIDGIARGHDYIAGQYPLIRTEAATLGLHLAKSSLIGQIKGEAISIGAFVSRPLGGLISGNAWLGNTTYRVMQGWKDGLWASGKASTIAAGIGLKATLFHNWTIHVNYETSGSATIDDLTYRIGDVVVQPPSDYQEPPFTYHAGSMIRIGVGVNLSMLPTREGLKAAQESRLQHILAHALNENIPIEYQGFAHSLVTSITNGLGQTHRFVFTSLPPGSVKWDPATSCLVVRMNTRQSYQRNTDYDTWSNSQNKVDGLYPILQWEFGDKMIEATRQAIEAAKTQELQAPTNIRFEFEFVTSEREPTSVKVTGLYTVVSSGGGERSHWNHLAQIELGINEETGDLNVVSSYTDVLQGGY